ncbi:MAG: class II aldolase/adducin family protein, partial [Rectinemataceae bacterium]
MIDTTKRASLALLAAVSRRFGGDPAWVLAGGGNTSWKTADRLYVKASGFALGSIDESGFCEMDRARLDAIWEKTYPADSAAREKEALADLMAARVPGETKRPSVETLLHGFFPQAFVVHTHPAIVNGLTCGREGEAAFRRLFGGEGIWVPLVDPGYILAKTVSGIFAEFKNLKGRAPAFMFMQNHGLLVAGGSPEEVVALSDAIIAKLKAEIAGVADANPDERAVAADAGAIAGFQTALRALAGADAAILHRADRMSVEFAASAAAFAPLSLPISPDHIVYAGHEYLRVDEVEDLADAWADYLKRNGKAPRIVLAKN